MQVIARDVMEAGLTCRTEKPNINCLIIYLNSKCGEINLVKRFRYSVSSIREIVLVLVVVVRGEILDQSCLR